MALVSDIILESFVDIGTITPGETITTAMQTDAFTRINQLLGSLSTEGAIVPNQVMQAFNLAPGTSAYTLGSGGSFATSGNLRAQKATAWRASFGGLQKGGPVLSMAEFAAAAAVEQKALAELNVQGVLTGQIASYPATIGAPIPSVVGADTSYPLINVRIFPAPSVQAGAIELAYWTPITSFATVGDTVSLPPGYEAMLHWLLGLQLFPQYGRPSMREVVMETAAAMKAAIMQQNSTMTSAPAAPPAQAQ